MQTFFFSTRSVQFSFDPCALLPLTLHLQMGDESEPVTAPRGGRGHNTNTSISGHFIPSAPSALHFISSSCHPRARHSLPTPHSFIVFDPSAVSAERLKSSSPSLPSPPLICGLCDVSHAISHPFPCGRTLLSHPASPTSPPPPLITAPPPRFVQGTRYPDLPPSACQRPPRVPHVCCCGAASALFPVV